MRNPSRNTIKRLFRANTDRCTPGNGLRLAFELETDFGKANRLYWLHKFIGAVAIASMSKGEINTLTGKGCEKYSPKGRRAKPLERSKPCHQ